MLDHWVFGEEVEEAVPAEDEGGLYVGDGDSCADVICTIPGEARAMSTTNIPNMLAARTACI